MTVHVLLTADNHLDPSAVQFGPRRFERKRDFQRCFEVLVNFAIENRPDLLLVGGDFYDTILPGNPARAFVTEQFKRLHERDIKIVLVSGHHDTPKSVEQGVSPLAVHSRSGHAYFLHGPRLNQKKFVLDGTNVSISGLSLDPNLSPEQDPLAGVKVEQDDSEINILLTHYPIEGFQGYFGQETHIAASSIPKGLQLLASGHLHKHQKRTIHGVPVIYPGSTERCSFQEEGEEKGFVWLEIDKNGIIGEEYHQTPARPMETLDFHLSQQGNLTRQVQDAIEKLADPEKVLRIRINGTVSLEQLSTYKRSSLLNFTNDHFFLTEFDEAGLNLQTQIPIEALPNTTPLQELDRTFQSLLAKVKEEDKKSIVHEAWKLTSAKLQDQGVV